MFVTKQFMVAIDFHSMKKNKNNMLQVNGYHQLWFVSLNKLLKLRIVSCTRILKSLTKFILI